jgi:hypothetical protein
MPSECRNPKLLHGKKTDASGDKPAAAGGYQDRFEKAKADNPESGWVRICDARRESQNPGSQSGLPPKPVQPAPGKRGGGFGMVVSGLIGAIIALGGGYGLQTAGLLPVPGPVTRVPVKSQALASRVDGLAGTI